MTDLKRVVQAAITAVIKAVRRPTGQEQSAAASMHLATQGIDMSTMRRD
ncbi:MAG: hypothetical protein KIT32_13950 [Rhodocyclaceae bacterium]|nr:hypothetical protein [Rhodocyclaceae bacterium]